MVWASVPSADVCRDFLLRLRPLGLGLGLVFSKG